MHLSFLVTLILSQLVRSAVLPSTSPRALDRFDMPTVIARAGEVQKPSVKVTYKIVGTSSVIFTIKTIQWVLDENLKRYVSSDGKRLGKKLRVDIVKLFPADVAANFESRITWVKAMGPSDHNGRDYLLKVPIQEGKVTYEDLKGTLETSLKDITKQNDIEFTQNQANIVSS